jgi:anti-sigma-K factor RskA
VWERRLYPLAENIPAQTPHPRVWTNIKKEIALGQNMQPHRSEKGLWRNSFLWRSVAFVALSLCAVLLLQQYVVSNDGPPAMPSYIAVLEASNRVPMFVATASRQSSNLIIKRMDGARMSMNKDLELWCYMKESDTPWSMGVLARKEETVLPLNEHDWKTMAKTRSLAISIEPMGGSPTGSPTGPVMYQGKFVSLI